MYISMFTNTSVSSSFFNIIQLVLTIAVMVIGGSYFYKPAFNQFRFRQLGMDALITISTFSAFLFSFFNVLNLIILYPMVLNIIYILNQ